MLTVASTDGVPIAVHHLAGDRDLPPVLISHATGFHAHCYLPVAAALADRHCSFGIDHRGHGATPRPDGWSVDWNDFGIDTGLAATTLAPDGGLIGVGHSMGGAALLMAAVAHPTTFSELVLFEPVVPVPDETGTARSAAEIAELPIVRGARRRRDRFESIDDAVANYASKPPLSLMTPEALRLYVEHGFRPTDDGDQIELRCSPEYEAEVFVGSHDNRLWDSLSAIEIPVTVVVGEVDDGSPARWAETIAARLPRGSLVSLPHQTHFGPFSHPEEFAELVG